jgi:hypothetical protein
MPKCERQEMGVLKLLEAGAQIFQHEGRLASGAEAFDLWPLFDAVPGRNRDRSGQGHRFRDALQNLYLGVEFLRRNRS